MKQPTRWVVDTKHEGSGESRFFVRDSYASAVDEAHKFFLSYCFEVRDGKPFDPGNDDGKNGGYDCFDSVKMYKGKVAEFVHYNGDGPTCIIAKAK